MNKVGPSDQGDNEAAEPVSRQSAPRLMPRTAIGGLVPTLLAAAIVLCSIAGLTVRLVNLAPGLIHDKQWADLAQLCILHVCLVPLFAGYIYYLATRYAFWRRQTAHSAASRAEIEDIYAREAPPLTVLVPSYKEEKRTILQTLMSAALAEYPRRQVMLLIDDPQNPQGEADQASLEAARNLPGHLESRFQTAARGFQEALERFESHPDIMGPQQHAAHLAELYIDAASILETWAEEEEVEALANSTALDHTDHHFIETILLAPAAAHRQRAAELTAASITEDAPDAGHIRREYRRLAALFSVEFGAFERKRYINLSHTANKAMNLNSYLGVMGGSYREVTRLDGLYLEECNVEEAIISPAPADYIIILDADSLIVSDYALRLAQILEQPGNERIGLIQTPYITVPNSPILIERVASATTDLHYFVQQGVSYFEAAYWVGPNSLIRRSALNDIMVTSVERGHTVKNYIQDRTLIEDTGSTIDLIRKGWKLHNYLDRLAYSATPADFGALLIQRRRWANGGLILLPALLRYLFKKPALSLRWMIESYLRIFTLISPTLVTAATLILIFTSFDDRILAWWLPFIAAPYYVLLAGDLRRSGYTLRDLPRVYAINLLLLPVVLGGVWQSLQQIFSGRKARFARTPKIASRTATPLRYLASCYGIFFFCALSVFGNVIVHRYYNACFSTIFMVSYLYGLARYITFRAAGEDVFYVIRERLLAAAAIWKWWTRPVPKPVYAESLPGAFAEMDPVFVESSMDASMTAAQTPQYGFDPLIPR